MSDDTLASSLAPSASPEPFELSGVEQRVLGTLVEKNLTTPDYYPMTLKALVAGCNQKNNRDPATSYTDMDVHEALSSLQSKKMVMAVRPDHGHATRWRHELDRKLGIQNRELAIFGELLLRGPATEGELRARASRMRPFPDVESLHETLQRLRDWKPQLAVRLSPEGAVRGVRHAHSVYPAAEMADIVRSEGSFVPDAPRESPASLPATELSRLRARLAAVESRLQRVESFLNKELGGSFEPGDDTIGLDG